MPAVVPLPASNRPLFGGAISVPVPTSFIDASQLREVPDHQEVFVDMNSDSSFIVELLEAEQPGEDPVAAARRHFEQLASDNEVRPEDCRILAVESLSNMMMALERPGIRATVLFGTQRIAKFNERGESAMNTVGIMMGLVQLGDVTTDVLITFNKTLQFGRESSSLLRFGDSAESGYEVSLGRFADMMRTPSKILAVPLAIGTSSGSAGGGGRAQGVVMAESLRSLSRASSVLAAALASSASPLPRSGSSPPRILPPVVARRSVGGMATMPAQTGAGAAEVLSMRREAVPAIPAQGAAAGAQGGLSLIAAGFEEDPFETSESDTDSVPVGVSAKQHTQSMQHGRALPSGHGSQRRPSKARQTATGSAAASDMGLDLEEEIEASLFGTQEHVSQDREQPLVVLESAEAAKVNIKPRKARNAQLTRIKVDGEVRQNPLLGPPDNARTGDLTTCSPLLSVAAPAAESKVIDWDLRARLAQLEQANSQLKFDLRNRDKEIKSLRKEMTAGITLAGTEDAIAETISKAGAGKDGKIIELAKKARRLTVAYEREKALNASLANQLKSESSQRKDQVTSQHKAPTNGEHDPQKDVGNHTQVKSFKEKLAQPKQMSRKLEEERMTSMNLKSELRLAQKALVQEIGEEVPIQKILRGEIGSWRGRSEQIALLKDKVRDLSRKLASRAAAPAGAGESDREGSGADGREAIQRIEQVRRVELDRLSAELEQVRQEHAESRTRCDGLAARNRTLEREVKDLKCKLARMLGKSETDDQLVRALQEQIQRAKGENEPLYERLRSLCAEQEDQIRTQAQRIDKLETEAAMLRSEIQTARTAVVAASQTAGTAVASAASNAADADAAATTIAGLTSTAAALRLEISELRALNCELAERADRAAVASAERVKQQRPAKERDVPGGRGRAGELQALQSKIEMLADENESLRLSLRLATEAKTRDLDTYKRLLEETRAMFESDIQAIVQRAEATQPALASDGKNM
ncbi:hypothetical protein HK105_203307 [Polyrhizophydium stewartii]|uniref:Kinesin motor domain-containing protein n=1 Tax=Polyrhizophydium stewartii TaxID=2732419 RepID=A0ABR4NCH9_9FUNG